MGKIVYLSFRSQISNFNYKVNKYQLPWFENVCVDVIPHQKGNSNDKQKGNKVDNYYLLNQWAFLDPVFFGW